MEIAASLVTMLSISKKPLMPRKNERTEAEVRRGQISEAKPCASFTWILLRNAEEGINAHILMTSEQQNGPQKANHFMELLKVWRLGVAYIVPLCSRRKPAALLTKRNFTQIRATVTIIGMRL